VFYNTANVFSQAASDVGMAYSAPYFRLKTTIASVNTCGLTFLPAAVNQRSDLIVMNDPHDIWSQVDTAL